MKIHYYRHLLFAGTLFTLEACYRKLEEEMKRPPTDEEKLAVQRNQTIIIDGHNHQFYTCEKPDEQFKSVTSRSLSSVPVYPILAQPGRIGIFTSPEHAARWTEVTARFVNATSCSPDVYDAAVHNRKIADAQPRKHTRPPP